jgi:acetate---CoA ligase (ADP-forming)
VKPSLRALLEPRSVAVVGASDREGSVGRQIMLQLAIGGFDGAVYPINPHYGEVGGLRCYPRIDSVPEQVDVAVLGVGNQRLEEQLSLAADSGARSAVVFASGLEAGASGPSLSERLGAIARDANMAICGGNCMGYINLSRGLRVLAFAEPESLQVGGITWLTHSGSAFSALLHNDRGLRFNLAVSTGQELTTTVADYLAYAVEQPGTAIAALLIESVRDPERFLAVLDAANRRGIPIVALKVGRERAAANLVQAHSGALAGEDAAYEAVFEAHGVIRTQTLNEMADVLELLQAGRSAPGGGLASLHDSGGERAHLVDVAADVGVRFARISKTTTDRLAASLDAGLPAVNPLDAWGTGHDFEKTFRDCAHALLEDPDTGGFAFTVDLAGEDLEWGYAAVARQIFTETDKPFAVLSNLSSGIDRDAVRSLRGAGVPMLEDTKYGLAAFKALFDLRDFSALPPIEPTQRAEAATGRWRARLASSDPVEEHEALELVGDYGIPVVRRERVASLDEALAAAAAIGYPVVLKTAARGVFHKSAAGGVRLRLTSELELQRAYSDMEERLGPDAVVAEMVPPGVEVVLGLVHDVQFGSLVLAGTGGVLVELLRDHKLGLPPLDEPRAGKILRRLRVHELLEERSLPPECIVTAMTRLSNLALDLGDVVDALDINPLIVSSQGCIAVDALVIPRTRHE